MEALLNRYRNLSVLLLAILAQLVLLAYQVKGNGEVRLIRVWAVTGVTPLARALEGTRSAVAHFFSDYFVLLDVREQNRKLRQEVDRVQMDNQYLRTQLDTADRAKSLAIFQAQSPSKTVAAHIIGNTTDTGAKVVIVDRGSNSGVQKGMAVITPDGIVGKVESVYPMASFVLLITDPTFAAGVTSQKNHVHGTVKGQGHSEVIVDYVQNEEKVDEGEWFYTSGDDLIFPKGLPVGQVTVVRPGKARKEIYLEPSGFQNGTEQVLIIIQGVHAPIPDTPPGEQPVHLLDHPPGETTTAAPPSATGDGPESDADRVVDEYRRIGEAEKHVYGERGAGAPNYNLSPADVTRKLQDAQAAQNATTASKPPAKQPNR